MTHTEQVKHTLDAIFEKYLKAGGKISLSSRKRLLNYTLKILGNTFIVTSFLGPERDNSFDLDLVVVREDADYSYRVSEEDLADLAASTHLIEECIGLVVGGKYRITEKKGLFFNNKYLEVDCLSGTVSFIKVKGRRYEPLPSEADK